MEEAIVESVPRRGCGIGLELAPGIRYARVMTSEPVGARQLPLFPAHGAPRTAPERLAPLPPVAPGTGLATAAGAFDEHLARAGNTDHTRRAFASDLRLVAQFLGAARAVDAITTDDLTRFLTWMLEFRSRPCSAKTYARRVTTLKVFFAWLVETGLLERDPALALVHRRAEAPLPVVLTDVQVEALLDACTRRRTVPPADPRPELLVRLLLDTGLKKGELTRLKLADIALEPSPSLLVRYDHARWRAKERRIGLDGACLPVLAAYRSRYQPAERLFECTDRNLEYVLADIVASAGLPDHVGFETLRWTSAVRHYRAAADRDGLRERLGLSAITWADTERKLALLAGE
jgi:site-specific recombinase XerD